MRVLAVFCRLKKTRRAAGLMAGVDVSELTCPPEDVAEDDDLLFLDFLEGVVLVRMFVAIEAAQHRPITVLDTGFC